MKKSKLLSFILAAVMIISMIPLTMPVSARESENGFEYEIIDGRATVTAYIGDSYDPIVPNYLGGYPVTAIGDWAFFENLQLTTVTLPESLTLIGNNAFCGCCNLMGINIPESVEHIGDNAFTNCYGFYDINIPSNVEFIGDNAFNGCRNLGRITLSYKVSSIGDYAFANTLITELFIPSKVTSLNTTIIEGCNALTMLSVDPANPVYYSESNCIIDSATSTLVLACKDSIIPENDAVTAIGSRAFANFNDLVSINIPKNITSIGYEAFYSCDNLQTVYYNSKKEDWEKIAIADGNDPIKNAEFFFENGVSSEEPVPEGLSYDIIDGEVTITSYRGSDENLKVPAYIEGYPVTCIGDWSFGNSTSLINVTLPDTVKAIGYYAFFNCYSLQNINIPYGVETIKHSTFLDCYSLTTIDIPETVTVIEDSVFSGCSALTYITLPDSLNTIGSCAFYNCTQITDFSLPKNVAFIGSTAFGECTMLKYLYIPAATVYIGVSLFSGCNELSTVIVDSENTEYYSYSNCIIETANGKVIAGNQYSTIPNDGTVTTIGYRAFYRCSNMNEVFIPKSVTYIDTEAFYDCYSLYTVNYGGSRSAWENIYVSGGNDNLHQANINYYWGDPNPVPDGLTFEIYGDEAVITGYMGSENTLIIPSVIEDKPVTRINSFAFSDNYNLRSITLPDTLTFIDNNAFSRSNCLEEIIIPEGKSELYVGDYAFSECTNLRSINLPDNVVSIGTYAFSNCLSLSYFATPKATQYVGEGAFSGCEMLYSLTITSNVNYIGFGITRGCRWLKEISVYDDNPYYYSTENCIVETASGTIVTGCISNTIPDNPSIIAIGDYAFYGITDIYSLTLPKNIISVGSYAFFECYGITEVYYTGTQEEWDHIYWNSGNDPILSAKRYVNYSGIDGDFVYSEKDGKVSVIGYRGYETSVVVPEFLNGYAVTGIEYRAFYYDYDLESITLPESISYIGVSAFESCSSLKTINLPDSITKIDRDAFHGCSNLEYVDLPQALSYIGISAFSSCFSLRDVTLPDGIEYIGDDAFTFCQSFENVVIPDSITTIRSSAFSSCKNLKSVTIPKSVTAIEGYAFIGCDALESVYIEDLSVWCSTFFANYESNPLMYANKLYVDGVLTNDVVIPDGITCLVREVFLGYEGLTSITLPEGLTTIDESAFMGCINLETVFLPTSITDIGYQAFHNCTSLKTVYYGADEKSFGLINVSEYNEPLYSATVIYDHNDATPDTDLSGLEYSIANGNASITGYIGDISDVIIPATIEGCPVTRIENHAFSQNSVLTSITLPSTVRYIGAYAFYKCDNLTALYIYPAEVLIASLYSRSIGFEEERGIGSYAFFECGKLTHADIPEGAETIGENAFFSCMSLEKITLPDSIRVIGNEAFANCSSLTTVVYGDEKTENEDWKKISIGTGNDELLHADIIIPGDPSDTHVIGDINGDGAVSAMDINLAKRFLSGNVTPTNEQLLAADANGDGVFNGTDSNILMRIVAGS